MNKVCPKCGAPTPDLSNFCPNCGYDLGYARADVPPPYTQQPYRQYGDPNNPFDASGPEGKCRGIAALLAFFLGGIGVHYFYMNKVGAGLLTILLTIVTCGIWGVITFNQCIYFLCISNEQFEQRFIQNPSTFPIF